MDTWSSVKGTVLKVLSYKTIISIATLLNYVRQKKNLHFFVFLTIWSSFYLHYSQLAGDTCLFQSVEKAEKAEKIKLFKNITVDMILKITVLFNEKTSFAWMTNYLSKSELRNQCNVSVLFNKDLSTLLSMYV